MSGSRPLHRKRLIIGSFIAVTLLVVLAFAVPPLAIRLCLRKHLETQWAKVHHERTGAWPQNVSDLVPAFIPDGVIDPGSRGPFRWDADTQRFVIRLLANEKIL